MEVSPTFLCINTRRKLLISLLALFYFGLSCDAACTYTDTDETVANCASQGLSKVPQSLNTRLTRIDLPNNNINTLKDTDFDNYPNLKHVQLQNNKINKIEEYAFLNLRYLSSLYLDENSLEELDFYIPDSLERLNLKSCGLKRIPGEAFKNRKYLENLDLSNNKLENVANNVFTGLFVQSIELSLDFSNNLIKTFPSEIVKPLLEDSASYSKLKVNILSNPIHCNCLMRWVVEYRSSDSSTKGPISLDVQGICASPSDVENLQIASLQPGQLKCIAPVIQNPEEKYIFDEHSEGKVECLANGDPKPLVFFKLSFGALYPGDKNGRYSVYDDGVLIIDPVKPSDAGTFLCVAGNLVQNTTSEYSLVVSASMSTGQKAGIAIGVTLLVVVILLVMLIILCCIICPNVRGRLFCCLRKRDSIDDLSNANCSMRHDIRPSYKDSMMFDQHNETIYSTASNRMPSKMNLHCGSHSSLHNHSTLNNIAKNGFVAASNHRLASRNGTLTPETNRHSRIDQPPAIPDRRQKPSQNSEHSGGNNNGVSHNDRIDNVYFHNSQQFIDSRNTSSPGDAGSNDVFEEPPVQCRPTRASSPIQTANLVEAINDSGSDIDFHPISPVRPSNVPPPLPRGNEFIAAKLPGHSLTAMSVFSEPEEFVRSQNPLTVNYHNNATVPRRKCDSTGNMIL